MTNGAFGRRLSFRRSPELIPQTARAYVSSRQGLLARGSTVGRSPSLGKGYEFLNRGMSCATPFMVAAGVEAQPLGVNFRINRSVSST
jgi:hypothetical protein